jgi:HSP20 family protein
MKDNEKEKMELERTAPEMVNPFRMMRRFTKDMERMFEDFRGFTFPTFFNTEFLPFRMEFDKVEWMPPLEVLQNNGQFVVRMDLPGMTKDDVKIEVTDKLLTISGERKEEKEEKREGFFRSERSFGSFFRQVPLPEAAKAENTVATFNNGVLEITMPALKVEPATRKVEITGPATEKPARAAVA